MQSVPHVIGDTLESCDRCVPRGFKFIIGPSTSTTTGTSYSARLLEELQYDTTTFCFKEPEGVSGLK